MISPIKIKILTKASCLRHESWRDSAFDYTLSKPEDFNKGVGMGFETIFLFAVGVFLVGYSLFGSEQGKLIRGFVVFFGLAFLSAAVVSYLYL